MKSVCFGLTACLLSWASSAEVSASAPADDYAFVVGIALEKDTIPLQSTTASDRTQPGPIELEDVQVAASVLDVNSRILDTTLDSIKARLTATKSVVLIKLDDDVVYFVKRRNRRFQLLSLKREWNVDPFALQRRWSGKALVFSHDAIPSDRSLVIQRWRMTIFVIVIALIALVIGLLWIPKRLGHRR